MNWGSIASAAAGAVGSIWSANAANSSSASMFNQQLAFNRESMQNRHQWEVADLKAAGLNPLMSVTSPTGTLSAGSAPTMQKADVAQSAAALGQISVANKMAEAQAESAQAAKINADTERMRVQSDMRKTAFDVDVLGPAQVRGIQQSIASAKAEQSLTEARDKSQRIYNVIQPFMQEAQLNNLEQSTANAAIKTAAEVQLMKTQGYKNISDAESYRMFVSTAEKNGIELRNLNRAEVKKVAETVNNLRYEHRLKGNDAIYDITDQAGKYMSNLLSFIPFTKGGD